jgi:hypothetical protein
MTTKEKTKIFIILISVVFLGASCNPLRKAETAGVVKTVNGGADWQFSNIFKDETQGTLNPYAISKIALNPHHREVVYASSYNLGIAKSDDSGASWYSILSKVGVYDFAIDPNNSNVMYAAGFFGTFGKLLKTTDGGASWVEVYNEQGTENPVRSVSINPNNTSQVLIGTASGSLIKSADGGGSWILATNFSDRIQRIIWQNNSVYVLTRTKGLFKSVGFAESFENISKTLARDINFSSLTYNTQGVEAFNQFYLDPFSSNLIYLATSNGVYKTTNGGGVWELLKLPIKEGESNARAIYIARSSSNIVFTSVGSTIYKSLDGGSSWQTQGIATNGFVNYILVDPELPQIVYAGVYIE